MKRISPWTVEECGIRDAGSPDHCFYCNTPKGEIHEEECVIRSRTVVVRFSIDLVVDVPESWQASNIEFKYNEGTWCANNITEMLTETVHRMDAAGIGCLCDTLSAEFVREADSIDEKNQQLFAETLPS
jgi:hypothetical protein